MSQLKSSQYIWKHASRSVHSSSNSSTLPINSSPLSHQLHNHLLLHPKTNQHQNEDLIHHRMFSSPLLRLLILSLLAPTAAATSTLAPARVSARATTAADSMTRSARMIAGAVCMMPTARRMAGTTVMDTVCSTRD